MKEAYKKMPIPTPCFVLDESLLRTNLEKIKYIATESGATIILALKGYALWNSFGMIREYLPGTTASSLHEARLGFEEFKGEVHSYFVAYLDHEFDEVLTYCSHLSFNSLAQWDKFKGRVVAHPAKHSCGIRINPEYSEVETDLYNPCIPGSRLGMTADKFGRKLPTGIEGLHMHNLCEKDSYALERTWKQIESKFGHLLPQIKWLNLGGGHAFTRADYDAAHVIELIKAIYATYPNIEKIILEPGSAVGWDTGFLISEVQDVIESGGKRVAILDASISAHMPDCIEMPYTARITGTVPTEGSKHVYYVGGLTCLAGDYMGPYGFDKPLLAGDKLVFEDMMHYTMVKTTTFNGVNLPSIGAISENGSFRLIKKFGYEDYKSRLS